MNQHVAVPFIKSLEEVQVGLGVANLALLLVAAGELDPLHVVDAHEPNRRQYGDWERIKSVLIYLYMDTNCVTSQEGHRFLNDTNVAGQQEHEYQICW